MKKISTYPHRNNLLSNNSVYTPGLSATPKPIQPKLAINQSGDKYEQEANAVADQVMRMETSPMLARSPLPIQRMCSACEEKQEVQRIEEPHWEESKGMTKSKDGYNLASPGLTQELHNTQGKGQTMDPGTHASMNNAFGRDLSHVRIHTDQKAVQMNKGIQAKAFTHGSDIFFNEGQYKPESTSGKHLLAHELTHVVQQGKGGTKIQRTAENAGWGSLIGAGAGALLGTLIGGAATEGTAAGFGWGALIGGVAGAAIGAIWGAFTGNKKSTDQTEETPARQYIREEELQAYIASLAQNNQIENHNESHVKARLIIAKWRTGNARFVLPASILVLLIRELINGNTSEADQQSILHILSSTPNNEYTRIVAEIGEEKLSGVMSEDKQAQLLQLREERLSEETAQEEDPTNTFDSETVYEAYHRFQENSLLPKKPKNPKKRDPNVAKYRADCIEIIRQMAPRLFQDNPALVRSINRRLRRLEGLDLKMTRAARELAKLGLVSDYATIPFKDGNGNNVPKELKESAWDKIMELTGTQQGWHIFGMAPFHGMHSVTILVHKRRDQVLLYWADQWNIDGPDGTQEHREPDSTHGFRRFERAGLDGWITAYTNSRWLKIYAKGGKFRKRRATLHIWKFRSHLEGRTSTSRSENIEDSSNQIASIQRSPQSKSSPKIPISTISQNRTIIQRDAAFEEKRLLTNTEANDFATSTSLAGYSPRLRQDLSRVPSLASAKARVEWWGYKLWEDARSTSQQRDTDDRPLYWTRLKMRQIIRDFQFDNRFTVNQADRQSLINGFERSSRGMPTGTGKLGWIPSGKKILISGFDPFQLGNPNKPGEEGNILNSNPSGAAALALDGEIVRSEERTGLYGQIQSVILPVSFDYFNRGRVEDFFSPYIQGSNSVDMLITISQGSDKQYELEEYASRFREPRHKDNEVEEGNNPQNLAQGQPFLRSTLPRQQMRRRVFGRSQANPNEREYRGIYQGREVNQDDNIPLDRLSQATKGSGGTFLSNEVFYRTTLLRDSVADSSQRQMPVGHLHIPTIPADKLKDPAQLAAHRNGIISKVRELIEAALPHI